jgi:hypothetical protein
MFRAAHVNAYYGIVSVVLDNPHRSGLVCSDA